MNFKNKLKIIKLVVLLRIMKPIEIVKGYLTSIGLQENTTTHPNARKTFISVDKDLLSQIQNAEKEQKRTRYEVYTGAISIERELDFKQYNRFYIDNDIITNNGLFIIIDIWNV
jgi:hypothetical protein